MSETPVHTAARAPPAPGSFVASLARPPPHWPQPHTPSIASAPLSSTALGMGTVTRTGGRQTKRFPLLACSEANLGTRLSAPKHLLPRAWSGQLRRTDRCGPSPIHPFPR